MAPGEDHVVVQSAPEGAESNQATGLILGCIWHLSDLHLCDAESPGRVEYLDRYADPDSPYRGDIEDVGTYRPQESLTIQVATTMIHTANAIDKGPVTAAPIDALLVTGDITDNAQVNELGWYRTIVEGGTIHPGSGGSESSWVGVSSADTWDEHYWHPDGAPKGHTEDRPTRLFGFPRIPGLIEASRQAVISPGSTYPVLSVHGNHDALLQGTVPADEHLRAYAIGDEAIVRLSDEIDPRNIAAAVAPNGPAAYPIDSHALRRRIDADPSRRIVQKGEFAAASGRERNYWTQDVGQLRVICLDTVNPFGGWQGSLDEVQFAWLHAELGNSRDRVVVIASHHPSPTMTNDFTSDGTRRILGQEVLRLLLQFPNVVMWIAGHVHMNAGIKHGDDRNWFWEVTTASLIDWPQQGRIIEFVRTGDDVEITSTVVDHDSPLAWNPDEELSTRVLAGISRLLAANDYQRREPTPMNELRDGSPEVRNAVWRVNVT
jgi:metallophosphoesterase (TIGR03767 family)